MKIIKKYFFFPLKQNVFDNYNIFYVEIWYKIKKKIRIFWRNSHEIFMWCVCRFFFCDTRRFFWNFFCNFKNNFHHFFIFFVHDNNFYFNYKSIWIVENRKQIKIIAIEYCIFIFHIIFFIFNIFEKCEIIVVEINNFFIWIYIAMKSKKNDFFVENKRNICEEL